MTEQTPPPDDELEDGIPGDEVPDATGGEDDGADEATDPDTLPA